MTCHEHGAVLKLHRRRWDEREAHRVQAHAHDCAECRGALENLDHARRLMANHAPTVSSGARTKIWERIQSRDNSRRRWPRWWKSTLVTASAGAAVAAAMMLFVPSPSESLEEAHTAASLPEPPPEITLHRETRMVAGRQLELALGRVAVLADSRVRINVNAPERVLVHLESGEVRADVQSLAAHASFALTTPQALLEVVGTSLRVTHHEETTWLEVAEGEVKVTPLEGDLAPRLVGAGEVLHWPPSEQPHAVAPKPPPVPAKVKNATRPRARTPATPAAPQEPAAPRSEDPAETLQAARAALGRDASLAAELARQVLSSAPPLALEVEALALIADALRRAGEYQSAAEHYAAVALHSAGRAYAEEALLQRALLLAARLEAGERALRTLEEARRRFPAGPLMPERLALYTRLLVEAGRPAEAAAALEAAAHLPLDSRLMQRRLDVAEALWATDPRRARRLLGPLSAPHVPGPLRARALDLSARATAREKK